MDYISVSQPLLIRGTPSWFSWYNDQGIVTIGGTPGTISRHPGWDPLDYMKHM